MVVKTLNARNKSELAFSDFIFINFLEDTT